MNKFSEQLNGMFLSEVLSGKIVKTNLSLTLNVEAAGNEFKVKSSRIEPRTDGQFSLQVAFPEMRTERPDVQNLIVELFAHPDTPEWLRDAMWEEINSKTSIDAYDPDHIRLMLKYADFGNKTVNLHRAGGKTE